MEVGDSSKKNKSKTNKKDSNGLINHLFSWNLGDVLNDDFYQDKVEKIPESFKSVDHYLESYRFPLLEETRAELSSSLKAIHVAPFAQVVSVDESKSYGRLLLNVKVDLWKNKKNNSAKEPYRTLPGDIFLLIDDKPETVKDLVCPIRTWAFAWVRKITENGCSTHLKLHVSKDIRGGDGMEKTFSIVFLMNVTTNLRIWNSLHFSANAKIIKQVLSRKSMGDEICNKCSLYSNAVCAEKLGMRLTSVLNDSQKVAVLCSVCKTFCDHKPSVELIWGPPGTGKTKTVSFLLWATLEMNQRILSCAPTNVAITELASRVVKVLKESSRAGSMFCSLGDMLLFGNKDRLKVGSELEEIYLDYRVDRLVECFGQTGWKYHITSMIKLLEGSNLEYHMFLECNSNMSQARKKKGDSEVSFLGFIREKFKSTAFALRGCLQTLATHIPKQFILEHNFQNIEILLNLIDSFGMLLFQDDVISQQIEILFSYPEAVLDFSNSSVRSNFLDLRTQCLSVMRNLQASLNQLELPSTASIKSVKKFCFQRASLILCTASCSFKLNSVKMDPVNLLVIDEAAQLKECESVIPLQLSGIKHAILAGDEFQLPAIVTSKVCDRARYGRSLFERLSLLGHSKHLLNTQYRMHPSISCFPNFKIYSNQILDAPLVMNKLNESQYLPSSMFGPYSFINVSVGKEDGDDDGHSKKNMVEVAVVIKIIEKLYKAWSSSTKTKLSIGVISFYAAQVSAIQGNLGRRYQKNDNFTVKVKSVDGFQGGEEDVIILSTVRSNRRKTIGFISNLQRINVALTRARQCLWIVGDATTLGCSNSEWEAVVSNAKDRRCFFSVEEDKDLADAIIEVKKALLELDDLLNKDSILFKMAQWKVFLSDSFRVSFEKVESIHRKKLIIVILLRLSSGWRPETVNISSPECSNIINHVEVEGLFIIYTTDIEKDSKYKYNQVLRIWDIKPLEAAEVLVGCISNIHEMYTDEYLNHCRVKSLKGDLEIPITWSASHDVLLFKDHMKAELNGILSLKDDSDDTRNANLKRNLLQMKFQSLSYQKAKHLLSGRDSEELNLPFQVEDEQLEIILLPDSAFIMGRPGAEKTAALTMKLFQREQQQLIRPGGCGYVHTQNTETGCRNEGGENSQKISKTVLRQLFITATLKQCLAVKEQFSYLRRISDGGNILEENQKFNKVDMLDMDDAQNLLDIPNSFNVLSCSSYPLVITFRKFLMMLDGTVGDSYFLRFYEQCKLNCGKHRDPISTVVHSLIGSKEITSKKFASSYWPSFDGRLTKKLDAVVVFNEITSQIKGGLGAKEAQDGKLSREDYTVLSKGQSSTLSRKQRDRIYDVFLDYERMKTEKGEYDLADLSIDLHNRLKVFQYAGDHMDFVYVDEVQGLTMTQIALLKYVCGNVNSGFVFSSNTAQTIAKDVHFRFQDIRFLFYKEFISKANTEEKDISPGLLKISDILHINQNRHTQPKILQLANSVMDLLFHFFPQSIDILCPETSEVNSVNPDTPVLLENGKGENVMTILFEERKNIAADTCGFGAEQVILVRDECAREQISNLVGDRAIILTIMESQCLEFQDVLLYNFFSSSPLEHHWRVIYQYMIEQDLLEALSSQNFNLLHTDLCWELKLLYVAITRSRQRFWIYEDKRGFSNPIFDYWKKLCCIQVKTLDCSIIQAMQVPSTKEKWSSLGFELFSEGVYEASSLCFQRADDPHRKEWARAASLRATANIFHGSNPQLACSVLQEAADIYLSINRAESAALCLIELKGYKEAGHIYLTKCGEPKLEDAGDCYMLAECYQLAADVYLRGSCFFKFLNVCTIANLFDMGLQVIQSWRKHDDVGLIEKSQDVKEIWHVFLEKGALHYHQLQDFSSMMKFVGAFNSMDAKFTFLRTLGFSDKILLLEENEKKGINITMKRADILLEIDLLEKNGNFKDASLLILRHVLFSSLWTSGKKGWPLKLFKRKERFITRAKTLAMNEDSFYDYVCTEANILSNQTNTLFEMEQNWSASHRHGNLRGIILSAWRILDAHLSSSASKYKWDDTMMTDSREHVEQAFSKNQVSVQILVYFWNFWREHISGILKYLQLPDTEVTANYASYEEFCLDYLGVRKQSNCGNISYLLLDPEAEWARKATFLDNENHVSINAQEFVAAAQSYWFSEVFAVGLKVISKLKDLHLFSIRSSLSSYSRAFTAIHIFEIAKFLSDNNDIKSLIDYRTLRVISDLGLDSILYLRLHQTVNPLVNEIQAVNANSQSYLLNCARHFHEIQDSCTTLKFVRAVCSMDSKRTFLKSFNYFSELLTLEMEAQNFSEALTIATLQGNILLEIDLLEKTENYREACLLLIFYICAHSLWTSESKGWPLKNFKHKQKLLEKVKSIARHDSETFYDMISTEANILSCKVSGLVEMKQNLTASEGHKNLRGVIISARKILDAHLQLNLSNYVWENVILSDLKSESKEAVSQNQVSFETLVCYWNFWKDRLVTVFDYLWSIETQDVSGDYESEQDFCLSYLGARRQFDNQETLYFLLNSDVDWAREVIDGSVHRKGGLIGIAACQFASAAQKYWSLEMFSVGIKVLEKLKALYIFSTSHSELCQSMIAINFCAVENFLMNFKFLECVSEAIFQNFTNVRLQFIMCCKQHLGQDSLVSNIHELNDVKLAFLRKCALHYHRLQDKRTMMKFVQAFDSIDPKRLFLKSLGCYDELLSLEEDSGNFKEAAAIARLKGDLLLEVDLLQKDGQLKEAVELVLFYVLASSLWKTPTKGWPLKQFKQKDKLLSKAKSIAELHSDVFHRIVCLETSILSDKICSLLEMKCHLSSSWEYENKSCEILSARKILDAHICSNTVSYSWEDKMVTDPLKHVENKISQNPVSIETLSHFWNVWKDNIMGVIKYLEFLGTKNVDEFIIYEGFCLKYLGVRKQSDCKNTYQLLFSEADWIMHISAESLQRNGKLINMDVQQFALAARHYWNAELLSVGLKVLEQLSDIHRFSDIKSLSTFHQSLVSIRIFEIANFLTSSDIAKLPVDEKILQDYLVSYANYFFDNVFGLSWTNPMTENMIVLRETKLCRCIIEAVIFKTIDSESELSYEKIGKVMMALFGSGKLSSRLYDMIAEKLNVKLHWKAVIDAFKRHSLASEIPGRLMDRTVDGVTGESFLINQLHEALRLTFVNWKKEFDYISPSCFLYVVERQFILISISQGCFYTTQSSFIEWLICEEWQGKPGLSMVDVKMSSEGFFDLIAKMVHELLYNNCGAREWIKRFNINSKEYYPIFLLRLVIIMCLLCANLEKYYDMLYNFLGKPDVRSQLPGAFTDLFKKRRKQGHGFLNFMAEALWKIKNPLVKVCSRDICRKPVASRGITIRMKSIYRKEDVWKLLFVKNPMDDNRDGVAIMTKQNANKMSKPLKSKFDTHLVNLKSRKSNASKIKMKLKKHIHCVNASMPKSWQKGSFGSKYELQVKNILDELNMSNALNMSDPELLTTIKEILRKLQLRRQEKHTSNNFGDVGDTSQITNLSSSSLRKDKERSIAEDKMNVHNMLTAKGSSQRLQFQPKLESVYKGMATQNDKTEDSVKVAHIMSTAKGSSPKLQFKPKLEIAQKELMAQTDVKTEKHTLKIANKVVKTKESTQTLQPVQKLKNVQKETTALTSMKLEKDKPKVSSDLSGAKKSLCKVQCELKLESLPNLMTSQEDIKTKDSSPKLQFKPKLESAKREMKAQADVKNEKDIVKNVARTKSTQKLQFKQKYEYVQKETAALSEMKLEDDKVKVLSNLSDAKEPSHKVQCELKLESLPKQMTSQRDVKAMGSSPKLQFKRKLKSAKKETMAQTDQKMAKQNDMKAVKETSKNGPFIRHPKEKETGNKQSKEKPHSLKGKMKVNN